MLRNLGVTGLVASLMGGFVLAMQGLNPSTRQPSDMSAAVRDGRPQSTNGATSQGMIAPSLASGQSPMATGTTAMATPSVGMQTQQKPMMGMCGGMMKMMMGGRMNRQTPSAAPR